MQCVNEGGFVLLYRVQFVPLQYKGKETRHQNPTDCWIVPGTVRRRYVHTARRPIWSSTVLHAYLYICTVQDFTSAYDMELWGSTRLVLHTLETGSTYLYGRAQGVLHLIRVSDSKLSMSTQKVPETTRDQWSCDQKTKSTNDIVSRVVVVLHRRKKSSINLYDR